MVAALHSYNHTIWLSFLGFWSFVELKSCHYIMIKADSHLKLHPASILDIYKVFKHIAMLSMGIGWQH